MAARDSHRWIMFWELRDYGGALVAELHGASVLWGREETHLRDTRVLQPRLLLPEHAAHP